MKITLLLPALLCSSLLLSACVVEDSNGDGDNNGGGGATTSPLNCDQVNRTQKDAPVLNTDDRGEITLSGTYRVPGRTIYDADQQLTIEPGTVFLMEPGSYIKFGWRGDPVRITAKGTAQKPILFCGTEKKAGHWDTIEFLHGTLPGSILEHVRFEDGGREHNTLFVATDIDLKSVGVYNSGAVGISMEKLGKASENLTVTGSALHPLKLNGALAVTNLPTGNYTGNGLDVAMVHGTEGLITTFHDIGIPYRQTAERLRFGNSPENPDQITFEAGVEYQFCAGCYIETGWRGGDHSIFKSLGTANKPVIFTTDTDSPTPGYWQGIYLKVGTREGSVVQHTQFHYGGKADGANLSIDTERALTVTDSKFLNSAGYGVKLGRYTGFTTDTNTFENNAQGDTNLP